MQEVALKTHLIITDIHEEYDIDWCGRLIDVDPLLENGAPIFVLISGDTRLELNTIDINYLEDYAKRITHPRGRAKVTTDTTRIYIKEKNDTQRLVCRVTHNHIKHYAPMYDKVFYH